MNLLKVFEKCNLVHNVHTQKYEAADGGKKGDGESEIENGMPVQIKTKEYHVKNKREYQWKSYRTNGKNKHSMRKFCNGFRIWLGKQFD